MVTARYAISRSDGSPIYYDVAEPSAPGSSPPVATIAMCDGIGCDGYVWKYLRRELGPAHRLIHWHYRGHVISSTSRR
jgi:pimeloyl-ACP methyl ester carboxylesterase